LNPAEKTVVRLIYEELWPLPKQDGPALAASLRLKPVRGYPKHAKRVGRRLKDLGLTRVKRDDIYLQALKIAGKTADDYSSKLELELDPDMRADEAAKVILRFLLGVIKTNEPYVKQDIDTEFLHDYRVAVRRTRSVLSQVKGVFPEETGQRFKRDFAYVGRLTNQLRDLDVYLLAESAFQDRLPAEMHDDLNPLFEYLRAQRDQVLQEVIDGFESDEYARILNEWESFLNESVPPKPTAAGAAQPIINLARQRIYKRYKRVIKDGTYILDHTQDQLLHDLRIEVKKLRYLMEFFASLFPAKPMNRLIKQLKRLHNNLGDFNDLFVQQQYLAHIAEELPIRDRQSRKAVAATGYLVKTLADEQEEVKAGFAHIFTDFASPANQKLFRRLFAPGKKRRGSK
jgi:CHAD domain-containing protein